MTNSLMIITPAEPSNIIFIAILMLLREMSAGAMYLNKEEVKQKHREACMVEQGALDQVQTEKEGMQRMAARIDSLGGITRHCLSSQG